MARAVAYLTRRETFSAAHRLHSPRLDAAQNAAVFGRCASIHGHNYVGTRPDADAVVEVTVAGPVDPATGMVMSLARLGTLVREAIAPLDHRHLDQDVEDFADRPSTAENIAVYLWRRLAATAGLGDSAARLHEVLVRETENNSASYRGQVCE